MRRRDERLLSAYVDGEVTPEERREVEAWLRQDPRAQQLYRELVGVRGLLADLPRPAPPPDLEAQILALARGLRERAGWGRRARVAAAGAVVAAAAALGLFPLVRGQLDRVRASEVAVHRFAWEHAVRVAADPLWDRAYVFVAAADAALGLLGERAAEEEAR